MNCLGVVEGGADDAFAALAGVDLAGDGIVVGALLGEMGEGLGVVLEGGGDLGGHGAEFHARVEVLGVLPEDDQIDPLLVVERIAGIGLAGPQAGVEVEHLAHADDGAAVHHALALELGDQLGLGVLGGLGGDGAEHRGVGVLEELDGARGEGLALLAPELPADVAVGVGGVELQGVQADLGRLHDLDTDAVTRQPRDFVAHSFLLASHPVGQKDANKPASSLWAGML